jgi:GNAT superfamily N-acetyltransferase
LISTATVADVGSLVALRTSVAQRMTERYGEGDWSALPSEAVVLRQLRASRILVARRDSQIVGTVRLATAIQALFDSSAFTPVAHAVYVLGLAVAPEVQGQGIGRALMEAAKDVAVDSTADALWLDAFDHAAGAGKFYEMCGFRRVGGASRGAMRLGFYEWLCRSR